MFAGFRCLAQSSAASPPSQSGLLDEDLPGAPTPQPRFEGLLLDERSYRGAASRIHGDHASDSDQLHQTGPLVVGRSDEDKVTLPLVPGDNQGADHGAVDVFGAGQIDDDGAAGLA